MEESPDKSSHSPLHPNVKQLNLNTEHALCDLFLYIVEQANADNQLVPIILDMYPKLADFTLHPYLQNISFICFPEGCKLVEIKPGGGTKGGSSFNHLTITQSDGIKKFATSLLFYEKGQEGLTEKQKMTNQILVPKAFCLISRLPIFDLHKNFLIKIYELHMTKTENKISRQPTFTKPMVYNKSGGKSGGNKKECHTSSTRNMNNTGSQNKYSMEFYLSVLFHHLYYNPQFSNEVEVLYSVPQLQGGKQRGGRKSMFRYRNYKDIGFTLPNFTFQILLERLDPYRIMHIFSVLLLERKLLLIHDNYGENALIIESLIALLSPLEWNFANISYLTSNLIEYIDAPFPYIIGVSRSIWNELITIKGMEGMPPDAVIFDVDKDELLMFEPVPPLPQKFVQAVITSLNVIVNEKGQQISKAKNPQQKEIAIEYYWITATLKVKQVFLNLLLFLINNFNLFYYPRPANSKEPPTASNVFDFDYYLSFFNEDSKPFMQEICKTQNFIHFIEKCYNLKEEKNKNELGFFHQCLTLVRKAGEKELKRRQANIIEQVLKNYKNPVTYTLEECYTQYERAQFSKQGKQIIDKIPNGILEHQNIIAMKRINYYKQKDQPSLMSNIFPCRSKRKLPVADMETFDGKLDKTNMTTLTIHQENEGECIGLGGTLGNKVSLFKISRNPQLVETKSEKKKGGISGAGIGVDSLSPIKDKYESPIKRGASGVSGISTRKVKKKYNNVINVINGDNKQEAKGNWSGSSVVSSGSSTSCMEEECKVANEFEKYEHNWIGGKGEIRTPKPVYLERNRSTSTLGSLKEQHRYIRIQMTGVDNVATSFANTANIQYLNSARKSIMDNKQESSTIAAPGAHGVHGVPGIHARYKTSETRPWKGPDLTLSSRQIQPKLLYSTPAPNTYIAPSPQVERVTSREAQTIKSKAAVGGQIKERDKQQAVSRERIIRSPVGGIGIRNGGRVKLVESGYPVSENVIEEEEAILSPAETGLQEVSGGEYCEDMGMTGLQKLGRYMRRKVLTKLFGSPRTHEGGHIQEGYPARRGAGTGRIASKSVNILRSGDLPFLSSRLGRGGGGVLGGEGVGCGVGVGNDGVGAYSPYGDNPYVQSPYPMPKHLDDTPLPMWDSPGHLTSLSALAVQQLNELNPIPDNNMGRVFNKTDLSLSPECKGKQSHRPSAATINIWESRPSINFNESSLPKGLQCAEDMGSSEIVNQENISSLSNISLISGDLEQTQIITGGVGLGIMSLSPNRITSQPLHLHHGDEVVLDPPTMNEFMEDTPSPQKLTRGIYSAVHNSAAAYLRDKVGTLS